MEIKGLAKILYVDDEKINLDMFDLMFRDKYDIITALSGMEGLDLIKNDNTICFVISDFKMPQMNGLELIIKIKQLNKSIPCIILSGYQKTQEIQEAINTGVVYDYIMKPFNKRELENLIDQQL